MKILFYSLISKAGLRQTIWSACALVTLLGACPLLSQAAGLEPKTFDVPAGPAITTLKSVAQQAGVEIMFSAEKVESVATPALKGTMTLPAALERLLAGTELSAVTDARSGAVTIRKRSNDQSAEKSSESKTGASRTEGRSVISGGARNESVGSYLQGAKSGEETLELQPFQVVSNNDSGYRVSSASVATRTNTALIDIPQTVNVVSKEFLTDIAAVTQEDAMGYVGNVFTRNNRQGPGQFIVRGFETNTALYLDGFATTQYKRDMAGYERVEVIKGPPSAVQGRGGDSGLLNFVAKKPELGRTFGEVKFVVGTEELFRGVVEGNLALAGREDMAARLVVVGENSGETVDDFKNRKKVFFPSFRWQITPRTDLVSFAEINFTETPATDSGAGPGFWSREIREKIPHLAKPGDVINALDIPIGTNFVGGAGSRDSFTLMSITRVTHRFSDHLQAQLGYQYINQDYYENRFTLEQNFPVANPLGTPGVWLGPVRLNISDEQQHVNRVQGDLFSQWEVERIWGQPKFTGMVGFEYNTIEVYNLDKQGNILAPYNYVNLAAPAEQSHVTFDEVNWSSVAVTTNNIRNDENKGVYLAGDVDFLRGKVILSAGGRRDFAARDTQNLRTGTSTQNTRETVTSKRYGITYKPLPRLAIYAVYSDQPDPERTQNVWGAGLPAADPRTQELLTYKPSTELKEAGLKGELMKGRATFQVAFFEMQRVNNSLTVSTQTSFEGVNYTAVQRSLADTTIRGVEIETFAAITDRLNLVANFAKNQSQEFAVVGGVVVERDTHRLVDWSSNVFLKYDMRSGRTADRRGFQYRAGMRAFGPFTATLAGVRERIDRDSYRFDVGASYQWGRSNFDLIVKNVMDEPTFIMRLDPMRQVVFTYTYRF